MERKLKSLPEDYINEGEEEHLTIEPPGAVLEIVEVKLKAAQHLLHSVGVAVVESGVAGNARAYLIEKLVTAVEFHYLVYKVFPLWAVANERHVATEDVPELRQLIEVVGAHETPDFGETRVILAVVGELRPFFLGIHTHGTHLKNEERFATLAYPLLAEKHRTPVLLLNQKRQNERQWREQDKAES